MRVLLVKAPRNRYSYFKEGSESLALGYLASYLRERDYCVKIIDGQLEEHSNDRTLALCVEQKQDVIGFTVADPSYISSTFELATKLRRLHPEAHLTIGGYAPSFHYKEVLIQCPAFDSVVCYEGEQTLFELVECLENGRDWRNLKGIAYRNGASIVRNDIRPLIAELDSLPFPARDYVPYIKQHLPEIGVVSIAGSRGCYADCGFCSIRQFYHEPDGPTYRLRTVSNIAEELENLITHYDVHEFLFIDDIFTFPGKRGLDRVDELERELRKRDLKVMFSVSDRVDHINKQLYERLYKIGVRQVMVGIEATNSEIIDYFNKRIDLATIRRALRVLDELSIDVTITYINFTPKTTLEILRENLSCLLTLKINFLLGLLNRLQVYVGTPIAQELMKQGRVRGSFPDFEYSIQDDRVERTYEICKQCFSPFLEISYEIMKIERIFRVKLFRLEQDGIPVSFLDEGKAYLKQTCRTIMKEAAGLFEAALYYAENNRDIKKEFLGEIRDQVLEQYTLWNRELTLLRDHSPFIDEPDRLLIR